MDTFLYLIALERFASAHGHARVPAVWIELVGQVPLNLGMWVQRQRRAYRCGTIDPGLAANLASLPGWTWDASGTNQARNEEMRELRASGMSLAQIGKRYGVTRQRVHQLTSK